MKPLPNKNMTLAELDALIAARKARHAQDGEAPAPVEPPKQEEEFNPGFDYSREWKAVDERKAIEMMILGPRMKMAELDRQMTGFKLIFIALGLLAYRAEILAILVRLFQMLRAWI